MNLRGKFVTDSGGRFSFRTVKPSGYPIPVKARWATSCERRAATTCAPRTSIS